MDDLATKQARRRALLAARIREITVSTQEGVRLQLPPPEEPAEEAAEDEAGDGGPEEGGEEEGGEKEEGQDESRTPESRVPLVPHGPSPEVVSVYPSSRSHRRHSADSTNVDMQTTGKSSHEPRLRTREATPRTREATPRARQSTPRARQSLRMAGRNSPAPAERELLNSMHGVPRGLTAPPGSSTKPRPDEEPEPKPEQEESAEEPPTPLQQAMLAKVSELRAMKLSAVKRYALLVGVDAAQLEEADDTDDIKETVISLILELEQETLSHECDSLRALKLSALKRHAAAVGVSAKEIEMADDTDNIKETVLSLIQCEMAKALARNEQETSNDDGHHTAITIASSQIIGTPGDVGLAVSNIVEATSEDPEVLLYRCASKAAATAELEPDIAAPKHPDAVEIRCEGSLLHCSHAHEATL